VTGWFYGSVDTIIAEKKLKGDTKPMRKGTFMVRLSSNRQQFTITKVAKDRAIVHQRMHNQDGKYVISIGRKVVTKNSLIELIESVSSELNLKQQLTVDNPFAYLFMVNASNANDENKPIYISYEFDKVSSSPSSLSASGNVKKSNSDRKLKKSKGGSGGGSNSSAGKKEKKTGTGTKKKKKTATDKKEKDAANTKSTDKKKKRRIQEQRLQMQVNRVMPVRKNRKKM